MSACLGFRFKSFQWHPPRPPKGAGWYEPQHRASAGAKLTCSSRGVLRRRKQSAVHVRTPKWSIFHGKLWTLCRIAWPRVTTSATTAGGVPDRKCEPRSRDIPSLQGAPVVYGFGHPNFCGFPIDFPTEFPGFSTRCPGFWIQFLIHSCQVHDRGLGGNDVWHLGTPHRALSLRSSIEFDDLMTSCEASTQVWLGPISVWWSHSRFGCRAINHAGGIWNLRIFFQYRVSPLMGINGKICFTDEMSENDWTWECSMF